MTAEPPSNGKTVALPRVGSLQQRYEGQETAWRYGDCGIRQRHHDGKAREIF